MNFCITLYSCFLLLLHTYLLCMHTCVRLRKFMGLFVDKWMVGRVCVCARARKRTSKDHNSFFSKQRKHKTPFQIPLWALSLKLNHLCLWPVEPYVRPRKWRVNRPDLTYCHINPAITYGLNPGTDYNCTTVISTFLPRNSTSFMFLFYPQNLRKLWEAISCRKKKARSSSSSRHLCREWNKSSFLWR